MNVSSVNAGCARASVICALSKVNHIDASADALATVASKLGHYADELERSDQRHHRHHAREFKRLAQLCEQSLFAQAERKWRSRAA